jgi:hypothetical protein
MRFDNALSGLIAFVELIAVRPGTAMGHQRLTVFNLRRQSAGRR